MQNSVTKRLFEGQCADSLMNLCAASAEFTKLCIDSGFWLRCKFGCPFMEIGFSFDVFLKFKNVC